MSLKEKISGIFRGLLPTQTITRFDHRREHPAIASRLDVDMLHDILEEAENGNTVRLFSLYRDIIISDTQIQGDLTVRKEAVIGDSLSVQPWDKKNAADKAAADAIEELIADTPCWEDSLTQILDSSLYPVTVLEKIYRPSTRPDRSYDLAHLKLVPYELLHYRERRLQIADTDNQGNPLNTAHDPDPRRYIVARIHTLHIGDWWGGPMRALLFWWLLCVQDRDWWAKFLDRYGTPFLVGKYPQSDDASRSILERAFGLAQRLGGLVVSRETEIEIKQAAATDSGAAYETFLRLCQSEKTKFILGQNLSSQSGPTGLGSGVADLQASVREDKRQADARRLGFILREQLLKQYLQINGLTGRAPSLTWGGISSAEITSTSSLLKDLSQSGLRIADAGLETLSERLGYPIERSPSGVPNLGPILSLSSAAQSRALEARDASSQIIRDTAADLSQQYRGRYAAIPEIILSSISPADAEAKIRAHLKGEDPRRLNRILEETLLAFAANGSTSQAR